MRDRASAGGARAGLALLLALGLIVVASPARAGNCDAVFSPNPGWRGATVQISGDGYTPNDSIYVHVANEIVASGSTDSEGEFSVVWSIPGDFPTGSLVTFVGDGFGGCDVGGTYTVNAGPPTTTAPSTTTTTPTTTTSSTTTTVAPTTTTVAPTTTTAPDTTTTTVAEADGGGGLDAMVWVLLIVVAIPIAIAAYLFGSRRRRGGG